MLNEQVATNVGPDRLTIAYERKGNPEDPVVLLVMGVAAQMVHWPNGFIDALLERGLQVIRFDNRDAGHSTHMTDTPLPDLQAAMKGDFSTASYTLSHMAADGIGLLDALGIPAAHVVGASLGGAIAQTMAIEHPERVLSLTSMMSTTGNPSVGQPNPEAMAAVFGGPPAKTRQEVIDRAVRAFRVVGSPGFPGDEAAVAEQAGLAYDRDHDELGPARQGIASLASGDRTAQLRRLEVPSLIIHGSADPICDVSGGRATAEAIPGAILKVVEGMGHNLPPGLWDRLADLISQNVARSKAGNRLAQP